MQVVVLTGPPTADRVRLAVARGRLAGTADKIKGGVVIVGPADPDPPAEALAAVDPAVYPPVNLNRYLGRTGEFAAARLAVALTEVYRAKPAVVVLDGSNAAFGLVDLHGNRAFEVPGVASRLLFWTPDRPMLVHFCPPEMHRFYVREWLRLISYDPTETVVTGPLNIPGNKLRFHRAITSVQQSENHPRARLSRKLRSKFGRVGGWGAAVFNQTVGRLVFG